MIKALGLDLNFKNHKNLVVLPPYYVRGVPPFLTPTFFWPPPDTPPPGAPPLVSKRSLVPVTPKPAVVVF